MQGRPEREPELIERAIEVAVTHHRGQRARAGHPYVLHVLRVIVAGYVQGLDSAMLAAAVRHDIVETAEPPFLKYHGRRRLLTQLLAEARA
jgi:(p)ppGpp synthase/HD superfamily hydrolase